MGSVLDCNVIIIISGYMKCTALANIPLHQQPQQKIALERDRVGQGLFMKNKVHCANHNSGRYLTLALATMVGDWSAVGCCWDWLHLVY